jgi:hypothetical protein
VDRRVVVGLVALFVLGSCGEEQPSRTQVLCGQFRTALFNLDDTHPVLAEMLDIGAEEDPRGIEGAVYVEAMLLAQAMEEADFVQIDYQTRFLLGACEEAA